MRVYEKEKDHEKPTKSVCEKAETRKKGAKNKIFWIRKEREKNPGKVSMFTDEIFKHLENS